MAGSRAPWAILVPQVAGLSRPPVLTAALTALTGIVSVAGLISPAVLDTLERTPAALHGEAFGAGNSVVLRWRSGRWPVQWQRVSATRRRNLGSRHRCPTTRKPAQWRS
jgi:hypothetical protein